MRTIALLVLTLLFSGIISAQYPDWECFYEASRINTLAKDNDNIWAGSRVGIVKINISSGEITHYNKQNSPIPDDHILDIVVDNDGKKWISTLQGYLYSYNNSEWNVYDAGSNVLGGSSIKDMIVDINNSLWMTTGYSGLFKFDGTSWTNYNTSNSQIPGNLVSSIFYKEGLLWAATNSGLACYDNQNWTTSISPNTVNISAILDIEQDDNGNLWLLHNTALEKFDGTNFTLVNANNSNLPQVFLESMTIDSNGVLWIACTKQTGIGGSIGGLLSYSDNYWTIFDRSNSQINDTDILQVLADDENKIWFGNSIGDIGEKHDSEWYYYSASQGNLDNHVINHLVTDKNGYGYVGTRNPKFSGYSLYKTNLNDWIPMPNYNQLSHTMAIDEVSNLYIKNQDGILKFDGSNWTSLPDCPPVSSAGSPWENTDQMAITSQGHIWIDYCDSLDYVYDPITGNYVYDSYNGIAKYDGTVWEKFTVRNSPLPSGVIQDINIDSYQNVWISTPNGLVRISNSDWTVLNTLNSSLPFNSIAHFAIDSLDNIWFSDRRFGLYKYDQSITTHYPHPTLSQYSGGGEIVIDIDGSIWQSSKLIRFDGSNWLTFDPENSPLGDYNITALSIDYYGNKWIGTTVGFLVYRQNGVITDEVNKPIPGKEILLYPNPFSKTFTLNLDRKYVDVTVTLFDAQSRCVFSNSYNNTEKIQVSCQNLISGMYLYRITAGNEIIGAGKIISGH